MPDDRPTPKRPRRRMVASAALVVVTLLGLMGGAAGAQDPEPPPVATTLRPLPDDAGRIVKHPNYGHEPTHPGDRGGWEQTLVLVLLIGALTGGVGLVWRDANRRRRRPSVPTRS